MIEWPCIRLGEVIQEFISEGVPTAKIGRYWTGNILYISVTWFGLLGPDLGISRQRAPRCNH